MIKIFMKSVNKTNDCWLWTGSIDKRGCGRFYLSKKNLAAYKFSYELFVGPILEGFVLKQSCRTRNCVSPFHLELVVNMKNNELLIQKFMKSVNKTDTCWLWTGYTNKKGYGEFNLSHGKRLFAHRFAYQLLIGPIPKGLVIDHLCRTRNCVNPSHLESVSIVENVRRGNSSSTKYRSAYYRGSSIEKIAKRDNWICQLCFEPVDPNLKWPHPMYKTRDHIIPKSKSGTLDPNNLRLAHYRCNNKRGAKKD